MKVPLRGGVAGPGGASSPTHLPTGVTAIAESGLRSADDLARLHALRYDAFLIGERLMTERDPGAALASLRRAAEGVAPR